MKVLRRGAFRHLYLLFLFVLFIFYLSRVHKVEIDDDWESVKRDLVEKAKVKSGGYFDRDNDVNGNDVGEEVSVCT